jgi:pilus assembly protein Flp/PilA
MGEAGQARGLSDAPGGHAAHRLVARFSLAFLRCQRGTTAIEYGIIVSLIFLAIVGGIGVFVTNANTMFHTLGVALTAAI